MSKLAKAYATYAARVDLVDEPTIAWFGGWLSADGTVLRAKSDGRPAIKFGLADRDPLDRFAALFGNAVSGPRAQHGLGKKPIYEWKISGWRAVVVLRRVLPWLSIRYRERAEMAASYRIRDDAGKVLSSADVADIRSALRSGKHGIGRELAKRFGVSDGLISAIKKGRVWS